MKKPRDVIVVYIPPNASGEQAKYTVDQIRRQCGKEYIVIAVRSHMPGYRVLTLNYPKPVKPNAPENIVCDEFGNAWIKRSVPVPCPSARVNSITIPVFGFTPSIVRNITLTYEERT
jgi:hypothetical protein